MRNHSGKARPAKRWQTWHVKVTFVTGAVLTGITDCSGHIRRSRNGSVVPISPSRRAERFVPYRDIESIELLDDPEYERIDNIEDVREGDEVFTLSGNKYKARAVYESMEVYADGDGFSPIIQRKYFAYALRPKPKPKLPDHDGLWLDKDNAIWQVYDHQAVPVYDDADGWGLQREVFSVSQLGQYAPFRPAKAVEA